MLPVKVLELRSTTVNPVRFELSRSSVGMLLRKDRSPEKLFSNRIILSSVAEAVCRHRAAKAILIEPNNCNIR